MTDHKNEFEFGFGTMSGWAAFRGWLWARITFKRNVSWESKDGHYHVVKWSVIK